MSAGTDLSWCPMLERMYRTREVVGRTGKRFDGLAALSTTNNLHVIRAMMLELKPKRTLEVGLAFGGSALTIAASHRDNGTAGPGVHLAIDLAQSGYWDDTGVMLLEEAGFAGVTEVVQYESAIALGELVKARRRFDFAYIDGSHQYEDVFVDFYFVARLLEVGGVVLFDDSSDPHVAKVEKFIVTNRRESFEELDLSRYFAGKARLRKRVADRLGRSQLRAWRKTSDADAALAFARF